MNKKLYGGLAGFVIVVAIIFGITVAHSGNKPSSSAGTDMKATSAIAANKVTIKDYMFSPANIKVKLGTTVTWTNQDAVSHTVTADTNSTDAPSSMDIAQGKSYRFTFKKAGTFNYHCFPHPYMHGSVEVTD